MFRPIRSLIFILIAFTMGVFYERSEQSDRCLDRGGAMSGPLCLIGGQE
jgi:hypothetical protein